MTPLVCTSISNCPSMSSWRRSWHEVPNVRRQALRGHCTACRSEGQHVISTPARNEYIHIFNLRWAKSRDSSQAIAGEIYVVWRLCRPEIAPNSFIDLERRTVMREATRNLPEKCWAVFLLSKMSHCYFSKSFWRPMQAQFKIRFAFTTRICRHATLRMTASIWITGICRPQKKQERKTGCSLGNPVFKSHLACANARGPKGKRQEKRAKNTSICVTEPHFRQFSWSGFEP